MVVKNYITNQEAESVLTYLNNIFKGRADGRDIKRFGSVVSYAGNHESKDIPDVLKYLASKLEYDGFVEDIRHVTVNRYNPGQAIQYHIDTKEAGEYITIISLASDAVMLFKGEKGGVTKVNLPANSLLQFGEEHRYKMKHSIEPVSELRYSVVFRKH